MEEEKMSHQENHNNKTHLGDGAYAIFDGYGIWLAANHHDNKLVYLEPDALRRLQEFYERMTEGK
jgi:hypothetical protein